MFDFINFHLRLIIFIFIMTVITIIILMIVIINIIILCASSKHAKRCKIWICDSWYYKEEFLILNFKCWDTFRCNGHWDTNKASKQLICSYDKNIVKRDFINIMNLFHAYVWLAGQSNKAFDEKSRDPPNLLHSQKWMQQ